MAPVDDIVHRVITAANNPEWRRPVGRPRLAWLKQFDKVYSELLGIGRVQAWELDRRSLGEWSRWDSEAMRHHGISACIGTSYFSNSFLVSSYLSMLMCLPKKDLCIH